MNILKFILTSFDTYCRSKDMADFYYLRGKLVPVTLKYFTITKQIWKMPEDTKTQNWILIETWLLIAILSKHCARGYFLNRNNIIFAHQTFTANMPDQSINIWLKSFWVCKANPKFAPY